MDGLIESTGAFCAPASPLYEFYAGLTRPIADSLGRVGPARGSIGYPMPWDAFDNPWRNYRVFPGLDAVAATAARTTREQAKGAWRRVRYAADILTCRTSIPVRRIGYYDGYYDPEPYDEEWDDDE